MLWTEFKVMALAAERITSLIHEENGPYDVLDWIRDKSGVRYNEYSMPYGATEVAKAIMCPMCLSVWVGLVIALIKGKGLLYGLALSMAVIHSMQRYKYG